MVYVFNFDLFEFSTAILEMGLLLVSNWSYAQLRHILNIHHQASFARHFLKLSLPSCCFHVGILFIFTALGIVS